MNLFVIVLCPFFCWIINFLIDFIGLCILSTLNPFISFSFTFFVCSFLEVNWHIMNYRLLYIFKTYALLSLDIFIYLWHHHHLDQDNEQHIRHPQKLLSGLFLSTPSTRLSLWIGLHFLESYISKTVYIIYYFLSVFFHS